MARNIPLREYWDLLADHIRTHKLRFGLLATMLLGSITLQIVNPQITRFNIDAAISGEGG